MTCPHDSLRKYQKACEYLESEGIGDPNLQRQIIILSYQTNKSLNKFIKKYRQNVEKMPEEDKRKIDSDKIKEDLASLIMMEFFLNLNL